MRTVKHDPLQKLALRTVSGEHGPLIRFPGKEPCLRVHTKAALLPPRSVTLEAVRLEQRSHVLDEVEFLRRERSLLHNRLLGGFDLRRLRRGKENLGEIAASVYQLAAQVPCDTNANPNRERCPSERSKLRKRLKTWLAERAGKSA